MVVSAFALAWLAAAVQSERVWAGQALAAAIQAASAVVVLILTMSLVSVTGEQAKRVADEAAIAVEQGDRSMEVLRRYARAGSLFQQNVAARVGL